MSAYGLLCLVLEPCRYSECGVCVGRYTGPTSTQTDSELIYIYDHCDSDKITLLGFSYCSTKHTAPS
jgi:hypothetical protein